jgi:hypothetical protein
MSEESRADPAAAWEQYTGGEPTTAARLLDEAAARIEIADEVERARINGNGIVSPGFNHEGTFLTGESARLHGEHMRLTAIGLALAGVLATLHEIAEIAARLAPALETLAYPEYEIDESDEEPEEQQS